MGELQGLIRTARAKGASDLHVIAGLPPAIRVNGEIVMLDLPSLTREEASEITLDALNEEQRAHLENEKELCFSIFDDEEGRCRITAYYHAGVPELSVRMCAVTIPDAATLGLPAVLDDLSRLSQGLVLITGANGVGKTTTLNYMIDLINRERRCKIVMIEDPVEYVHMPDKALIVQQEIHTDTLSFPRALVHVLRQNPDVIVIGEMRELDTIATALTAAETGHLVLATLHTPNTSQAVERITTVFPGNQQKQVILQLANCLQGVVTQDLIPRADGSGRVLAFEVLLSTPAVRAMIRENNIHMLQNALSTGRKEGMLSMDQCLQDLYAKAEITYDAAASRMRNPKSLNQR